MGTRFELVLVDPDPGPASERARRRLRAAGAQALEVIEACDARWSTFRRDSLVARIRREAARAPVRVDEETWFLLEASLELWHATEGAFDVGLGGTMEALGFRGQPAIAHAFSVPSAPPCELDASARTVRMTRPGALLDLGGVAKGFALDLAARELREAGLGCALLHGGTSSVVAIGGPEAGSPGAEPGWRIAVRTEDDPARAAQFLTVRLHDASLSVSAPRGRTATASEAGARKGHVIDPASGRSVELGWTACAVAPSGLLADALATALVAGAARRQNLSPALACQPHAVHRVDLRVGAGETHWVLGGEHASVFHLEPNPNQPSSAR